MLHQELQGVCKTDMTEGMPMGIKHLSFKESNR